MLPETMAEAGMQLNATTTDFATLMAGIDHTGDTVYNMYNLANGFCSDQSSPWYYFSNDPAWMGTLQHQLDRRPGARLTRWCPCGASPIEDTGDLAGPAWRNFIQVWNEKLPDIPLYSDEYYDFYTTTRPGLGYHLHLGLGQGCSGRLGHRIQVLSLCDFKPKMRPLRVRRARDAGDRRFFLNRQIFEMGGYKWEKADIC